MPLDPFFAERLRVHRRYLLGQAVQRLKPGTTTGTNTSTPKTSKLSPRERHRRSARAWDRTELQTVGTPPPDVPTEEHIVPVEGYPDVAVRIYRPRQLTTPAPAVLAFFGGAFRIGGVDHPTTDAAYRRRAVEAGVIVVAVHYALAPEHRYPTQIEQGSAALDWLHEHATEQGVDPARIAVQGTSAGAAIAAAVTLVNRDRARHPLRMQLLEVPVLDLTARYLDLRPTWAMGIPAIVALRELRSVAHTYLPRPAEAKDAYASPLRATRFDGLPPALIMTAEYDPLRRQGAAYAAALRRAGVDATAVRYDGAIHDIWIFTGVLDAARRWHDQAVGALRTLHD